MTEAAHASRSKTPAEVVVDIAKTPLNWLLLAIPVAVGLHWSHAPALAIFIVACIAVVPLAGLMGRATENLAETLGAGLGGFLNATFGNAAELIIALMALSHGPSMYPMVKASITGSIIGNVLLVLGLSIFAGGLFYKRQKFNATAAGMGAALLALAGVGLLMPSLHFWVVSSTPGLVPAGTDPTLDPVAVNYLSEEIAVLLAITYVLSLLFSLFTHSHLFQGEVVEGAHAEAHVPEWDRATSITILILATVGVAFMSEMLVSTVEVASHSMGLTQEFVGVIVVAVIGNAAEHSSAVLMAMKNKMDLAVGIAVGSSIQIALFVAPVLVFASWAMGHPYILNLHFTAMQTIAVIICIGVLALVAQDGESHWMEGVMLLGVYIMLGLSFFHLPASDPGHAAPGTKAAPSKILAPRSPSPAAH